MKAMKFQLILAAMLLAMSAMAQNPYAEIEDDEDVYAEYVKFSGQKPGIADFVTSYIGDEPEFELTGMLYDIWQKHLKNKPLDKNEKLTVDAKNGFVRFEKLYPDEGDGESKTFVEICYWNCSDGKHKVVAYSVGQFWDGKAIQTEFGGIWFGLYNNDTHKIIYNNGLALGMDVIDVKKYGGDDEAVVTYNLPRVGKDITAVINNLPGGNKEIAVKWNGLKFEVQQ